MGRMADRSIGPLAGVDAGPVAGTLTSSDVVGALVQRGR